MYFQHVLNNEDLFPRCTKHRQDMGKIFLEGGARVCRKWDSLSTTEAWSVYRIRWCSLRLQGCERARRGASPMKRGRSQENRGEWMRDRRRMVERTAARMLKGWVQENTSTYGANESLNGLRKKEVNIVKGKKLTKSWRPIILLLILCPDFLWSFLVGYFNFLFSNICVRWEQFTNSLLISRTIIYSPFLFISLIG